MLLIETHLYRDTASRDYLLAQSGACVNCSPQMQQIFSPDKSLALFPHYIRWRVGRLSGNSTQKMSIRTVTKHYFSNLYTLWEWPFYYFVHHLVHINQSINQFLLLVLRVAIDGEGRGGLRRLE